MKSDEIRNVFSQFEAAASDLEGVECWIARELQVLLGYSKWENFEKVTQKAKDLAAEMTGLNVQGKGLGFYGSRQGGSPQSLTISYM